MIDILKHGNIEGNMVMTHSGLAMEFRSIQGVPKGGQNLQNSMLFFLFVGFFNEE